MCGITGFVNFKGHQKEEARVRVRRMTDIIAHRGPDSEGYFIDDYAALGHRRLAIIDVSSGHQPMSCIKGRFHIVFNGEIYNFLEIREELERKGRQFNTRSDTEVILYAFAEWGPTSVERMNGMFAFAIWDTAARSLFIARDRVGKKPLYFVISSYTFAFASELKSLRAGGFCSDKINPRALDCYFSFGYVPSPMCIYENIQKLRPAYWIQIDSKGNRESRYWNLNFSQKTQLSMQEAVEELEPLIDAAVRRRLMSEVPLGVFLSGGIDSPLVTESMARASDQPVISNSIGFNDNQFNELPIARQIAEYLGADHHEFIVETNVGEVLEKIAWHFDEPFADSSAIPTWYVCKMAKENVTVALSGDGGDESFGGYTFRYHPHILESRIRGAIPQAVRAPIFSALGKIYPGSARLPNLLRVKTILENLAKSDVEAFYHDLVWLRCDLRNQMYSRDFLEALKGYTPFEEVRRLYSSCNGTTPLDRSQWTDIKFYMTENVLVKVDRMSMAHSLEVRSPFLDQHILEFAARLPDNLKIKGNKGKLILRKIAEKRLLANIVNRPKVGFSIPVAQWLRKDLKVVAEQAVTGKSSVINYYINQRTLSRVWNEHKRGIRDHGVFLWGLLMLTLWEKLQ